MSKKILIVGLRISELREDPQKTLLGNPMRSWALFKGLGKYGFETKLFIGSNCDVDEHLLELHGKNFIYDSQSFIVEADHEDCVVVICGTRIHETINQHPWILNIKNSKIVLAQCYHNVMDPLSKEFVEQINHALFVTPKYLHSWNVQYPNIPTSIMTTGQIDKQPDATEANGDAVFVGHIHNINFLNLMAKLAACNDNKKFHIVTSRIKTSDGSYIVFKDYEQAERLEVFAGLVEKIYGAMCPANLLFHFLPPGKEDSLMNKVTIGIDYTWNPNWVLDNSKVPYYLTYGLNVIAHLPAPSHRFVTKFNAGVKVRQGAPLNEWDNAIKDLSTLSVEEKNQRRIDVGKFFSWDNVTFDVASVLLELSS